MLHFRTVQWNSRKLSKNWIYPEIQVVQKFMDYQDALLQGMPGNVPTELTEMMTKHFGQLYKEEKNYQGSLLAICTAVPAFLSFLKNGRCEFSHVDATCNSIIQCNSKIYEKFLSPDEVLWFLVVYGHLYPNENLDHVHICCECFHQVDIFGERFISCKSRSIASSIVCTYWEGFAGSLCEQRNVLRVGAVQYFIKHSVSLVNKESNKKSLCDHIFAHIHWFNQHPRDSLFVNPVLVVSPDFKSIGYSSFILLSCIMCRCAIISDKILLIMGKIGLISLFLLVGKFM